VSQIVAIRMSLRVLQGKIYCKSLYHHVDATWNQTVDSKAHI